MLNTSLKTKTLLTLTVLFFSTLSAASHAQPKKIAIIIDDMGYRITDKNALSLPGNVTYSFLPHTTYGKTLAVQANVHKHDVLIHIPMESKSRKKLGPGALTSNMSEEEYHQSLTKSLADIPFAIGINNHMGSYLTQFYQPMAWTMAFLKENDLFFLDSKTNANSKAQQAAKDFGVPIMTRHVFLDNKLTESYISKQFALLIKISRKNAIAIGIAHPHPETIATLTKLIPTLASQGVELVPLSSLYPATSLPKVAAIKSNK